MRIKPKPTLALCLLIMSLGLLSGAYLRFQPVNLSQPDGTKLELYASGDEFYNWLHDKNGYTVKQNSAGWYVYLDNNSQGELVSTAFVMGQADPASKNLKPWANVSSTRMGEIRKAAQTQLQAINNGRAPSSGTLNNLSIFIRFSDQSEFTEPISNYSTLFNGTTGNTMQAYFLEASYNALNITTSFYPTPSTTVVSWQDSHPRAYYSPYSSTNTIGYDGDAERTDREFTLLVNASNGVSSMIPTSLNLDGDNDGLVDNVCFIIQGSSDGWSELLWPHRWSIYDRYVYINGKRVYDFNFQLSAFLASSGVGVLCHEMFHSLGAPDLYHYSYDGLSTVGSWDLMENNTNPPQHMGAFMKYKYGHWIASIPELTVDGTYTLNPLVSATNNCYQIPSPNSTTEYFVVEYRRDEGTFESSIPGSGMLIYRINTTVGEGNSDGPPDEVYIYRPNGTTTANGSISSANYSLETGRTAIDTNTNPTPFLTNGTAGGLKITNISSVGATISFVLGNPIPGAPSCTIDSPANGTVYNLNSLVTVNVTATDADGTVTSVAFYVNDVLQNIDYSAPYSWVWDSTGYPGGFYTLKVIATDNSGIEAVRTVTVFLLAPPDEGFETGDFTLYPWDNSSAIPWTVQSSEQFSGTYAAKSGPIGDSASTSLSLALNVTNAGAIAFYEKASSESGWDFLTFYLDGVQQGQWSGAGTWTLQSYPVTAGLHTFTWTYAKDTNTTGGSDCAWLDHIILPPNAVYYAPPQNLSATAGNGIVNLAWQAPASGTPTGYRIYKNGSLLTTVSGLSYSDTAVVNGTPYSYYLIAVYSGGESEATGTVQATPNVVTSVILGTGTSANGTTVACPVNIYYRSLHGQSVYTRAELNALGVYGPINITQIGFYVVSAPLYALPNFTVRMKHTADANVANWQALTGMTTVYTNASYLPTAGSYNMLTLSTPFLWNGVDNIVIDTGFAQVTAWNQSGTTQYTSVTNGYRYTWNDDADQTNVFAGGSTSTNRPNLKLTLVVQSTPLPEIVVNPTALSFGAVAVGSNSTLPFTIQNTGDAALNGTITTPAGYSVAEQIPKLNAALSVKKVSGLEVSAELRNTITFTVNPGVTKYFDLTFTPTAVQTYPGNVVISSNDADEATVNIAVTGSGFTPPNISLDNTSLSATLAINAGGSDSFTISNTGSQNLTFTLAEAPPADWLTWFPPFGTVLQDATQEVVATFNASGLAPGVYQTSLLVNSNDPDTPQITVSVELTVSNAAPTIALPPSFEFAMNANLPVDFDPFVADVDGQTLVLGYSGNTNVLVAIDGLNVTFSATPGWFGSEELTFSVYDGYDYAYDTVTVTVNLNYLAAPVISSIAKTTNGVLIQWEPVANANAYHVWWSVTPYGSYEYLGSTELTLYEDLGANPMAFYKVIATDTLPVK